MLPQQVLVFPDAEGAVIGHLSSELSSRGETVDVGGRRPSDQTRAFVRVSQAGATDRLVTSEPMLTISIWAETTVEASRLGRLVQGLTRTVPGIKAYTSISGLNNYPDPDTNLPRYQFTVQLKFRGKPEGAPNGG